MPPRIPADSLRGLTKLTFFNYEVKINGTKSKPAGIAVWGKNLPGD